MTPLVDALQASGLAADVSLGGRWAEFQGERRRVYVFETARGGYYTWCDEGPTRAVEFYPDPHAAIQAGLRRAAEELTEPAAAPLQPDLTAPAPAAARPPPAPAESPVRRGPRAWRASLPARGGRRPAPWAAAAFAALGVLALLLVATLDRARGPACPDETPTVREVLRVADCYYGQAVAVGGEVDEILGARAFTIREAVGGDRAGIRLLIVSARPLPPIQGRLATAPIVARDLVMVGGEVQPFVLATIEREAGLDLDDATFVPWAGQPTLVARSVSLTLSAATGGATPPAGGDDRDDPRRLAPIVTAVRQRNVPFTDVDLR